MLPAEWTLLSEEPRGGNSIENGGVDEPAGGTEDALGKGGPMLKKMKAYGHLKPGQKGTHRLVGSTRGSGA